MPGEGNPDYSPSQIEGVLLLFGFTVAHNLGQSSSNCAHAYSVLDNIPENSGSRASLLKCQERARKQFPPLWKTCDAGCKPV